MNGTCNVSLMQFKLLSHVDTEKNVLYLKLCNLIVTEVSLELKTNMHLIERENEKKRITRYFILFLQVYVSLD